MDCNMIKLISSSERKRKRNLKDEKVGSIAQLGEHLPYKQRVIGSSPIVPTNLAR